MADPIQFTQSRFHLPSDVDNRLFSALLAVWIGLAINRQSTTIDQLIKILFFLTVVSAWLKICFYGQGELLARLFVYATTILVSYGIGQNISSAYTSNNEILLLRNMFPLIVFFWLVASEINQRNWRRAIADYIAFRGASDG